MTRPFHLGWFLANGYGVHGWNQAWGGRTARDWASPALQIDLARALERACFDFLLLEDSLFVPDNYGGARDVYLRRAQRVPKNDPLPLVPLIAQATRHLGIVPTISTSFYPPYLLARLIATLDLLSEGRVGCNFVTSTAQRAAENFGLKEHLDHDLRYDMADEFVALVRRLWDSWEEDALVMDEAAGVFTDPAKVHEVNFEGRFHASRGPLNTARPPQGQPVLVQAGSSPKGRDFAARHMDVVLGAANSLERMKSFREDVRRRAAAQGRDPDGCKVMFLATPTLGETDEEARARHERGLAAKMASPETVLAQMSSLTDIDFSQFDLDAPVEELTTNGQQGTLALFLAQGRTLREIVRNYHHGYNGFVGTPATVAAEMAEAMQEVGGDGFMIAGPLTRRFVAEATDGLVPALQARGLARTAYGHAQFRDNLMAF